MNYPPVTVEDVTVDRDLLLNTKSPSVISLDGSQDITSSAELNNIELRRAFREQGGRVFLLTWEGRKIPRGANILGHIVRWTQGGVVINENGTEIGNYDRLVEFGGASGTQQKMLVYLNSVFCRSIILPPSA